MHYRCLRCSEFCHCVIQWNQTCSLRLHEEDCCVQVAVTELIVRQSHPLMRSSVAVKAASVCGPEDLFLANPYRGWKCSMWPTSLSTIKRIWSLSFKVFEIWWWCFSYTNSRTVAQSSQRHFVLVLSLSWHEILGLEIGRCSSHGI